MAIPTLIKSPAPQGTAERLIQIAKSYDGYVEGPKNNQTIFGEFTKANYQPWCGSFVMFCANQAGVKLPNVVGTIAGAEAFQKLGSFYTSNPQPGDLVFYAWEGKIAVNNIQHVEIYVKDLGKGSFQTVAGNVSPAGSQANGGQVMIKTRTQFGIVGYGRPDYAKSTASPIVAHVITLPKPGDYPGHTVEMGEVSDNVKFIQKKLKVGTVDGQFGPVTQKAVQHFQLTSKPKITETPGVVGPKTWKALQSL